jgi:hypothetical protein
MTFPTRVHGRYARSVRLDAAGPDALDGYLPTARALDVTRRIINGIAAPDGTRAFSITGPYGSGKSSLAVFLDALCSAESSKAYRKAVALLTEHDPDTAALLPQARASFGAGPPGFARAIVTAPQREPVAATVLRALANATKTFRSTATLREQVTDALSRAVDDRIATPSYHEIRDLIAAVTAKRPLLLVIDEFGKNLEAYNASGADGDMYLLQELAEWSSDPRGGLPMVLVTIQHLAFEAYAANATAAQRREWAKVQGRFEDIPYVDSASATRNLIAVALDQGGEGGRDAAFATRRRKAAETAAAEAAEAGLPEVAVADLIAACWPLHPSTLLVLPELCARYGQNERTLFSFLASAEPLSVTSWVAAQDESAPLGWVRLDRVYDYFVESAGNFLSASLDAARWNEVSTLVRDSYGLTGAQLRVLKTVGVLNLVAAGGMLRASRDLVAYACVDGQEGTADAAQVTSRLTELEALGLLTHRDFAQEYRIWRGSDFDLNTALQVARRTVKDRSTAALLTDVRPMPPLVAGRHSTRTGTVRAFERSYADATIHSLAPPPPASVCDGLLVYRLEDTQLLLSDDATAPVVVVDAADLSAVAASAIELAALLEVAEDPSLPWNDLAARRELAERTAHARMSLDRDVTAAFAADATWTWINAPDGERVLTGGIATSRLSQVLDEAYAQGPARVAYESINRAELTSAGAKARRTVQNAVVDPSKHAQAQLGLEGDGAEVAVYRAVLLDSGVHDPVLGVLRAPTGDNGWARVWQATLDEIQQSDAAVSTDHLLDVMMSVPYGLREGTASLLLTALLVVEAPNLAVYEHGTFTPRITGPLVERLVRNPKNFAVKHLGTARKGRRWKVLTDLNRHLDDVHVGERPESITVLSTVRRLAVAYRAGHSTWSAKTRRFTGPDDVPSATIDDAVAVRKALTEAREPDVLLFEALPAALGLPPVRTGRGAMSAEQAQDMCEAVADAMALIIDANRRLALAIFDRIAKAVIATADDRDVRDPEGWRHEIEGAAHRLAGVQAVSPEVRSFIQACLMNPANAEELASQIATTVTGVSPRDWDDHSAARYLSDITSVAQAFRRIADLERARASHNAGDRSFSAYAVTLTAANGKTIDKTVTLTAAQHGEVAAALNTALGELAHLGEDATEALLAGLTGRLVGDTVGPNTPLNPITPRSGTHD